MFDGNANEAFHFYKSVFGGEFAALVRYGDMPADPSHQLVESDAARIMHIALPIGNSDVLMASDVPEKNRGEQLVTGNRHSISISTGSKQEADIIFRGLSQGGQVEMPIGDSPWGTYFGMVTDKYAIQWMVDFDPKNQPKS